MGYEHTQRGHWYLILLAVAIGCVATGWLLRHEPAGHYISLGIAILLTVLALCFIQLTVRDEQDALAVRFGPFPLFFTRIPYDRIRDAQPGRTTLLDGWGIHYLPGRGTTYNIWGFSCVRIDLDNRIVRIGSDDVENLVMFLRSRIAAPQDGNMAK